jgi:3-hydroxyisobutyrate dehydrogenase-like beta-hydroxyacid dehydrogenase
MKVGVIGVGAMGHAMAGHLVRNGHDVTAYDLDQARLAAVREAGGRPVASLTELAAGADILIVMVVSDAQSRTVVNEICSADATTGSLIAITATNHPNTMRELAETAAARGLRFIDAPVCFGLQGAKDGELVSLCGGTAADVSFAAPALRAYSRAVYHVGPVGAGQLAKTCNNMLHWAACVANFEVLLLAKRFGVDAQRLREILLDCPGQNGTLARRDTTRFTWPEKDMDIALDLAQAGGLPLPLFGQIDQLVKLLGPQQVHALLYEGATSYLGRTVAATGTGDAAPSSAS